MLISNAFRKANITSIESEPTEAEIEDAAHTLNVMLQSWNNDGFRLFKIKDGYMPFIPKKNDYSLATQAYKSIESGVVTGFEYIGATKIELTDYSGIAEGQKILILNNVVNIDIIKDVVYESGKSPVVVLSEPMVEPLYDRDPVFHGVNFDVAKTEIKEYESAFQTIPYDDFSMMPQIGHTVWLSFNNTWVRSTIYSVDAVNKTITLSEPLSNGKVTNSYVVYGDEVYLGRLTKEYPLMPRKITATGIKDNPVSITILSEQRSNGIYNVESFIIDGDISQLVLEEPLSEDILKSLGVELIDANKKYSTQQEVYYSDLAPLLDVTRLDWGSITDTEDLQTDDWGNIVDAASVLEDWGTLTGDAQITGFGKSGNESYVTVYDSNNDTILLFGKLLDGEWSLIDTESNNLSKAVLFMDKGTVFLVDQNAGVFQCSMVGLINVYNTFGVEKIIKFNDLYYLVGAKTTNNIRPVTSSENMSAFADSWTIDVNSIDNPAEFLGKIFFSKTSTFVTKDFKDISNIEVYSDNRCVIGDRLLNMNTSQYCSFSKDGKDFLPMPLMVSNQSAWGYKDGCSFIAVYGVMMNGIVGTQIYTANEFNPVWMPQVQVPGKVVDIQFDSQYAYFVSDIAVVSLEYRESVKANDGVYMFAFGEQIGRPQQIMNVMKYGFDNQVELPLNALSLQEFTVLPRSGLGGEPVNYCFMREAEDGKMMVWGTPSKFGEYLKFSYVEPLTLLEGARSTPDFPDEYYEAVENGLAAELAATYGAPIERQQALAARAQESKENAMLHDNEDTTYNIVPNQRWL